MAEELIDTFTIVTDDGEAHTVYEYQDFIQSRPLSGPVQYLPGLKRLVLETGGHVNFVSEGNFKIVASGKAARRA